ncbi:hypothetical protein QJS04_geneDACA015029 [Acorus gramineus]|uniref:Secreted protein n=1 Tax=Acorus gramineus TaxID=55184 RepID=A0AAV9BYJ0_ACOGR|nr:hypothetical protein QJS04_geneDACA015029 [Acorus gramineus]
MPHRTRPMTAILLLTGLNLALVPTIGPVYDFVCFLPYWDRRASKNFLNYTQTLYKNREKTNKGLHP